jgi:hypothetical protein
MNTILASTLGLKDIWNLPSLHQQTPSSAPRTLSKRLKNLNIAAAKCGDSIAIASRCAFSLGYWLVCGDHEAESSERKGVGGFARTSQSRKPSQRASAGPCRFKEFVTVVTFPLKNCVSRRATLHHWQDLQLGHMVVCKRWLTCRVPCYGMPLL